MIFDALFFVRFFISFLARVFGYPKYIYTVQFYRGGEIQCTVLPGQRNIFTIYCSEPQTCKTLCQILYNTNWFIGKFGFSGSSFREVFLRFLNCCPASFRSILRTEFRGKSALNPFNTLNPTPPIDPFERATYRPGCRNSPDCPRFCRHQASGRASEPCRTFWVSRLKSKTKIRLQS